MVEMRITKEIGNYKPRVVGPLTFRQLVCVGIAAPFCYFIYKFLSPHVTRDLAGFFCILPAAVAALFGWYHPYGMNTEEFIRSVFVNIFLAPSHRKYKTENQFELIEEKLAEEDAAPKSSATGSDDQPSSVAPEEEVSESIPDTASEKTARKQKKQELKKPKYKRSKLAYK